MAVGERDGRITIAADLGPPASTPQFGGEERRWVAQRIRFEPALLVRRPRASAARKTVALRGLLPGELRVGVRVRTTRGRVLKALRTYAAC
jgi:hypothetical protein